ncbi:MAG: SRPBCC family protein [Gammaproteobacteria bacterium]
MNNTRPLRIALLGNAVFSATSGLVMLTVPDWIGTMLGIEAAVAYRIVGIGLLIFAMDLIHQATRPRLQTWRALYAVAADLLWVLGSIVGLLFFSAALSHDGVWIVGGVAVIVLAFGIWQLRGIDRAHRISQTGLYPLYRHCVMVESSAPADDLWALIRDLGKISRYMPSLRASMMLNHQLTGVGAIRRCINKAGDAWAEKCTAFDDTQRHFTVRFLTEEPGFPFPASRMQGGWRVDASADGSTVTIWWELVPKSKLMAPLLLPLLAWQADRDFPRLIAHMTDEALGNKPAQGMNNSWQHSARLLAQWC